MRRFWKILWKLHIPYKVHHFAWRACRDILPAKEILTQRHIIEDGICKECKEEVESSRHMFWSCPRAREMWFNSKLLDTNCNLRFHNFLDILWYVTMIKQRSLELGEIVVTVAWALWNNRNEVHNEERKKSAAAIVQWGFNHIDE